MKRQNEHILAAAEGIVAVHRAIEATDTVDCIENTEVEVSMAAAGNHIVIAAEDILVAVEVLIDSHTWSAEVEVGTAVADTVVEEMRQVEEVVEDIHIGREVVVKDMEAAATRVQALQDKVHFDQLVPDARICSLRGVGMGMGMDEEG